MAPFVKWVLLGLLVLGIFLPEWLPRMNPRGTGGIERIISLSPAETQNFAYLGLVSKIVGVSPYDKHPEVQDLPKLPGINSSEEEILRLKPDMLAVSETSEFDRLARRGILVYVSQTGGLEAVYSNLLKLEAVFEVRPSRAEVFHARCLRLQKEITPKGRYLMVVGVDPVYSVSTNTFLSEAMGLAGWENAVSTDNPYPVLGDEELRKLGADVVFAPLALAPEQGSLEKIRETIGAGRIAVLSNDNLMQSSPFILDEIENLKNI